MVEMGFSGTDVTTALESACWGMTRPLRLLLNGLDSADKDDGQLLASQIRSKRYVRRYVARLRAQPRALMINILRVHMRDVQQ